MEKLFKTIEEIFREIRNWELGIGNASTQSLNKTHSFKFYASDVFKCRLKRIMRREQAEAVYQYSDYEIKRMARGSFIHERIQEELSKVFDVEVEKRVEGEHITGKIDLAYDTSIIELKVINHRNSIEKKKLYHEGQVLTYRLLDKGYKAGYLVYLNDKEYTVDIIKVSNELMQTVRDDWIRAIKAWEKWKEKGEWGDEINYECLTCEYAKECEKRRKERG